MLQYSLAVKWPLNIYPYNKFPAYFVGIFKNQTEKLLPDGKQ